jgi:hypothetical protein
MQKRKKMHQVKSDVFFQYFSAESFQSCYVAISSTSELKTKLGNVVVISLHIDWEKEKIDSLLRIS